MNKSAFTYRHLDQLGKYSPTSPLRVIALIDFDAFYAQCEIVRLGLPPTTPLAVQQWNDIIALNYASREFGLRRGMPLDEAKKLCPSLILQHVATWREGDTTWAYRSDVSKNMAKDKSALDPYRLSSRRCFELIKDFLPPEPKQRVEKASIDEVFLDLSAQIHEILLKRYPQLSQLPADPQQHLPLPEIDEDPDWAHSNVLGLEESDGLLDWDDIALSTGAEIVSQIRAGILQRHKYTCSAGIARNKLVAKLSAGHKKPNEQTVVLNRAVADFLAKHELRKLRGLGGKLGLEVKEKFGSSQVADILQAPLKDLELKLGNEQGNWVYNAIRGKETSAVSSRIVVQSMISAKTFVPNLADFEQALKWLRIFAADLMARLNELQHEYPRRPSVVAMHHHINGRFGPTRSKQCAIPATRTVDETAIFTYSRDLLRKLCDEGPSWPCAGLSVSIAGFEPLPTQNQRITSFFDRGPVDRKRSRSVSPVRRDGGEVPPQKLRKRATVDDEVDKAGTYECPICSKRFGENEVLEHLDWHAAMDIQAARE